MRKDTAQEAVEGFLSSVIAGLTASLRSGGPDKKLSGEAGRTEGRGRGLSMDTCMLAAAHGLSPTSFVLLIHGQAAR